jgi:hypothetical protein
MRGVAPSSRPDENADGVAELTEIQGSGASVQNRPNYTYVYPTRLNRPNPLELTHACGR